MIVADYMVIAGISGRARDADAARKARRRGGFSPAGVPVEPAFARYCTAADLKATELAAMKAGHFVYCVVPLYDPVRIGMLLRTGIVAEINDCAPCGA